MNFFRRTYTSKENNFSYHLRGRTGHLQKGNKATAWRKSVGVTAQVI